jgi:hypothetical protein
MSVPVLPGSTFSFGNPQVLFDGPYLAPANGRTYDAAADGQRFLMIKETAIDRSSSRQVVVVLNWDQELKRLVPTN